MSFREYCTGIVHEILDTVLPDRTKRLLLISSLSGRLLKKENINDDYLALLNTQLSLCREEDAIRLPIAINEQIWPECPIDIVDTNMVSDKDITSLVKRIMEKIPEWLKYDRESIIEDELSQVLKLNSVFYKEEHNQHVLN